MAEFDLIEAASVDPTFEIVRPAGDGCMMALLDCIYLTQDLDRIAEADELFDAVLTGSVDRERNGAKKAAAAKDTSNKDKAKLTNVKIQKGAAVKRKLSLYIGNFPWVCFIIRSHFYFIFFKVSSEL